METTFLSELEKSFQERIPSILRDAFRKVSRGERDRVAELVQSLADGSEDPIQKNILEEVATAIRRLPDAY